MHMYLEMYSWRKHVPKVSNQASTFNLELILPS